ncbi:MAG: hypothetical protein H7125_12865, partial [Proteobacteria bacterium]|nr:hypothetical protein [Burkholderiales bacterium]
MSGTPNATANGAGSGKVYLISPEAPVQQGEAAGVQRDTSGAIRLAVLDNSKSNADHLLAMIIEGVGRQIAVKSTVTLRKMNPSTPAPKPMLDQL